MAQSAGSTNITHISTLAYELGQSQELWRLLSS